jgi:ABC-2 type transport system permease protein
MILQESPIGSGFHKRRLRKARRACLETSVYKAPWFRHATCGGCSTGAIRNNQYFLNALSGEWRKFRSYPVTLIAAVACVAFPVILVLLADRTSGANGTLTASTALANSQRVLQLSQVCVVACAAGIAGQEYQHSALRTSLICVPRRGVLLAAKYLLLTSFTVVGYLLAAAGGTLAIWAVFGIEQQSTAVVRALLPGMLGWLLLAWFALGLTVVLRSQLAVIAVLGVLLLGGGQLLLSATRAAEWLPTLASTQLFVRAPGCLPPATGGIVGLAWALAATIAAALSTHFRDAR